ncbi:MAG: hypothetical protein IT360_07145 [Gemmatimonadaceae bacterium]|nr:hypothetical protein [Gemmatimonadaceae bacterium]
MQDTLPEAQRVLLAAIRRREPMQRLLDALRLSDELRAVAVDAARRRHPGASVAALVAKLTGEPAVPGVRYGPRVDA